MQITTYIELTPAQEHTLEAFRKVVVRTVFNRPSVVATFQTFQVQEVKLTIDANGVIEHLSLEG